MLFLWRQGEMHPKITGDDECRLAQSEYQRYTLPQPFSILGWCGNGHPNVLKCRCPDNVWTGSEAVATLFPNAAP